MASISRKKFDENAVDIENLIELHGLIEDMTEDHPDIFPERLHVLYRSAIVLMVSYWESYIEDICSEALDHLIKNIKDASKLPKEIKKQVANDIKEAKNDLELWKIADQGWREYLTERLEKLKEIRDRNFNTPKAQQTTEFIRKTIGIEDIKSSWGFDDFDSSSASKYLDSLIEVRGQIAHRGNVSHELNEKWVKERIYFIKKLVSKTGGKINSHLKKATGTELW